MEDPVLRSPWRPQMIRPAQFLITCAFATIAGCKAPPSTPTTPPSAGEPDAPSTETEEPAPADTDLVAQGKILYADQCAGCHGDQGGGSSDAPPVIGPQALPLDPRPGQQRDIQFRTALDVLQWVQANMPPGDGGSLTDEQALAIVAFELSANGIEVPGGTLDRETAAQIVLHP